MKKSYINDMISAIEKISCRLREAAGQERTVMDYRQSREYIEDAQQYGSVLGLEGMRELMKRLGNPQDELKIVHVAGTNGKGSVIAYLYTVLSRAGYRVGRYISPTLYSYRERMEIAGARISRESFARHLTAVAGAIEDMIRDGLPHPTPFEIETAVAFLFFREEQCDLVLLEVGLGGSLDATNVIPAPVLAVLTSISVDHQAYLGNTLEEIAEKKAGIIKTGSRAVTTAQKPEVQNVIRKAASDRQVPLREADTESGRLLSESYEGQTFSWHGEEYVLPLAGACQMENAILALEALRILEECGYPTSLEVRKEGLLATSWRGRFTVIHRKPLLVVDGAHNPGAAEKLAQSIERYFRGKTIYYLMGMFRDKDCRSVIARTCSYARKIFTIAAPNNPRALTPEELAGILREFHPEVEACETLEKGVEQAFQAAGEEDVIIAFGSLAFIGDLTEAVRRKFGGAAGAETL